MSVGHQSVIPELSGPTCVNLTEVSCSNGKGGALALALTLAPGSPVMGQGTGHMISVSLIL
jgi:hypothetical protein